MQQWPYEWKVLVPTEEISLNVSQTHGKLNGEDMQGKHDPGKYVSNIGGTEEQNKSQEEEMCLV